MQELSVMRVGGFGGSTVGGGWHLTAATRAAAVRVEGGPTVGPTANPAAAPVVGPAAAPATVPVAAPIVNAPAPAVAPATMGAATTQEAGVPATQPAKPTFFDQAMAVAPLIVMAVLVYLLLFRGKQKEQKKHKAMIAELKKGDRVMTIGGLIARVVAVDGEDVTLKIDESANVKAVYRKSSIQQVLGGEEKSK